MSAHDGRAMSCEEVALRTGMSVAGVSKIERRALRKLRKSARDILNEFNRRQHEEAVMDSALSLRFSGNILRFAKSQRSK